MDYLGMTAECQNDNVLSSCHTEEEIDWMSPFVETCAVVQRGSQMKLLRVTLRYHSYSIPSQKHHSPSSDYT